MLAPHASVGAAQTAFYVPVVIATAWLLFYRHRNARLAWICLILFSLFRIAGGVLLVLYTQQPDKIGLIVTTILFEGAGVIPLMMALVGLLRIILEFDLPGHKRFGYSIIGLRALFFIGIAFLVAGSVMLIQGGYSVLIVCLGVIAGFNVYFWLRTPAVSKPSQQALWGMSLSIPFLVVRMAYACLYSFGDGIQWNPLIGSAGLLVGMHSLMEYAVVLLCLTVGYKIPRITTVGDKETSEQADKV